MSISNLASSCALIGSVFDSNDRAQSEYHRERRPRELDSSPTLVASRYGSRRFAGFMQMYHYWRIMLFCLFRGACSSCQTVTGMRPQTKFPVLFPQRPQSPVSAPSLSVGSQGDKNPWAQELSFELERSPAKSILPGRARIFTYESNAVGNREPAHADAFER